jgi:hypothetical protein
VVRLQVDSIRVPAAQHIVGDVLLLDDAHLEDANRPPMPTAALLASFRPARK